MIKRNYYSVRTGKISPDQQVNFEVLKKLFSVTYNKLNTDGYFQKYFGINCEDGYIPGELGEEIEAMIFVNLRKDNLYPIYQNLPNYTEDDFFDIIEFLYDHCSKGLNGHYHNWNNCGYHYEEFNDIEGQKQYRELLNPILREYKDGFEISESGEILILSDNGLSNLFEADIPTNEKENVSNKINSAILKFRRYKSTLDDRREAIRELADVLEFIRPAIKEHLNKKDENDIFNIANNFGIRHHNKDQQTEYDKAIWYSWIFYYYLATLHAVLRMTNKK
ncbi:hypothetical protein SAMN04488062_10428 [Flavobacterium omnivorum]|uniref:Uncharacterized protein n=1 Tax=Flavobacterium omnivorum TaxID=178355 RepID=A0A1G7ZDU5_9FLAO|nr:MULTISPECIES: hypothetical protein [Flavobacterium]SDH06868.1 hypothetical protein SAMN04488062_10428 [Flavobacterium omnivorum]